MLFAMVMSRLTEVRQESLWTLMFTDGTVIYTESKDRVGESVKRLRYPTKRRRMKVSRSKI